MGLAIPPGKSAAYAYLTPAIAHGDDRDEGLDCEFFYGEEPAATARALASGACQIACLNTIVGFLGRDEGLPVVAVGSKARRTHRYFAVLPEGPITSLVDLKGKTMACDFSRLQTLAEAALFEEGVTRSEFNWVPWRGSGMEARQMVAPLRRGEIDAIFLMDWNDGNFIAEGLPLRHLRSSLLERIRVSSCYWTTESTLKAQPEIIAHGIRAILRSVLFSFENPEAAVRIMWERFPETRPSPAERTRILRRDIEVLKACLEPMRIDVRDPDPRWCAINHDEMAAWQTFLRRSGALRHIIEPAQLYSTALVDRCNEFKPELVRAAARTVANAAARC